MDGVFLLSFLIFWKTSFHKLSVQTIDDWPQFSVQSMTKNWSNRANFWSMLVITLFIFTNRRCAMHPLIKVSQSKFISWTIGKVYWLWCLAFDQHSGGSRGRQGCAPWESKFFHFQEFFWQNRLAHPLWKLAPSPSLKGNPGSATAAGWDFKPNSFFLWSNLLNSDWCVKCFVMVVLENNSVVL